MASVWLVLLTDFSPRLPRNFRDAVQVTRALGYNYIWIDSLCIIQDYASDWVSESGKMAEVYKYATVTIVPTSANSCHDGFLHPRMGLRKARIPYIRPDNGECEGHIQLHLIRNDYMARYDDDVNSSVWNQRGWTLQERMLSSRILHFSSQRSYLECKQYWSTRTEGDEPWCGGGGASDWTPQDWDPESEEEDDAYDQSGTEDESTKEVDHIDKSCAIGSEDGDLGNDDDLDDGSSDMTSSTVATLPSYYLKDSYSWYDDKPRKMFEQWNRIVFYFCQRSLTFAEDKLPALEGLARDLSANCNVGRYFAGLWEHDLAFQLLWAPSQCHYEPLFDRNLVPWTWPQDRYTSQTQPKLLEKVLDHGSVRIPTTYRAPSWSWASLDAEVLWLNYQHMGTSKPDELPKYSETSDGVLEVLDVDFQFQGDSNFGRMTSGRLTLNAVYQRISVSGPQSQEEIQSRSEYAQVKDRWDYVVHNASGAFAYGQFDFQTPPTGALMAIKLINQPPGLGKNTDIRSGLILEECGDRPSTYRRAGLFVFQEAHLDAFDNVLMRPITLV